MSEISDYSYSIQLDVNGMSMMKIFPLSPNTTNTSPDQLPPL